MLSWWQWVTVVLLLVAATIYATLWALEDTFLLHPARCPQYVAFDPQFTEYFPLPSGGLVVRCKPSTTTTTTTTMTTEDQRAILCLHGNAGNLDGMAGIAQRLLELGYDVFLMEPLGYGICSRKNGRDVVPTTESLVQDLHEAWSVIPLTKRHDAILFGFSMGGGIICQFLNRTKIEDDQLPSQIALLNTYYDLPMLVNDIFPIPGVSLLMRTQWNALKGIQQYCLRTQNRPGNVLVVAAIDDELIPIKHAHLLHQSIQDTFTQRKIVILPNGGHNNSIETHAELWLSALLPSSFSK